MDATHATTIQHLTDESFQRDIESSRGIAVVKFTADWCPPCKALKPVLESLATEYAGRVAFHELDTDAHPRATVRYGVRGLPTTVIFRDGREAARVVGLVPKEQLRTQLDRIVGG
ncbi:MAG: thioredoxin family protein [Gemmatimonadaceae bacterium]